MIAGRRYSQFNIKHSQGGHQEEVEGSTLCQNVPWGDSHRSKILTPSSVLAELLLSNPPRVLRSEMRRPLWLSWAFIFLLFFTLLQRFAFPCIYFVVFVMEAQLLCEFARHQREEREEYLNRWRSFSLFSLRGNENIVMLNTSPPRPRNTLLTNTRFSRELQKRKIVQTNALFH